MATVIGDGGSMRIGPRRRRFQAALLLAGVAALALSGCAQGLRVEPVLAVDGERVVADTAADPYQRGKIHLRDGRPGLALQEFRTALARSPGSVMALNGLGIAYDQLGRFDLAERYYHRALAQDPASAETLNNIGYSALRQGKVTLAQRYIERAHRLNPADEIVLANLDLVAGSSRPGDGGQPGAPAPTHILAAAAPAVWVERTSAMVQTVVTRPNPELTARAMELRLHPALFSFAPPTPAGGPAGPPPPKRSGRPALRADGDRGTAPLRLFDEFATTTPLHLFDEFAAAAPLSLFDQLAAATSPLQLFDHLATISVPAALAADPAAGNHLGVPW